METARERILNAAEARLLAIGPAGQEQTLVFPVGDRPALVSADPTGRLAVLDPRAGSMMLIAADRSVTNSVSLKDAGVARPIAVELGLDGRGRRESAASHSRGICRVGLRDAVCRSGSFTGPGYGPGLGARTTGRDSERPGATALRKGVDVY